VRGSRTRLSPPRPATPASAPLSLRIDRLVLDGLSPGTGGGERLCAALEAELRSLFASGALHPELRHGGAQPRLRMEADGLRDGADPERLGRGIAAALHRGIGR